MLPFSAEPREAVETGRGQIRDFDPARKAYQQAPAPHQQARLEARCEEIFTTKTGFQRLNLARKRLPQNTGELVLVLDCPEVPLHNKGSEREIRE